MAKEPDKLLIIDADKRIRDYFSIIGQKAYFEVAKAIDEAEMRQKVSTFSPTVIMLGLHGPVSDAVKKLKLLSTLRSDAKIILLCEMENNNSQTATAIGQIFGLNMSGTIQKPLPTRVVCQKLKMLRNVIN